jgi:hypothetical protein
MIRVLIFFQKDWAFGSIHNGLLKNLLPHGISCDFLDWSVVYEYDDFNFIAANYDYILTGTGAAVLVLHNNYNIPLEKIVAVAHAKWDLEQIDLEGVSHLKLHKIAAVHEDLVEYGKQLGIKRKIEVARNGVDFDFFYSEPSKSLRTIGYAGKFSGGFGSRENRGDIKRGFLVKNLSEHFKNLNFKFAGGYHFLAMPSYYAQVDAVICASTEESCGLPMLEAACAGRLCMSTPVGYFKDHSYGVALPIDPLEFDSCAKSVIADLSLNGDRFAKMSRDCQEYARYYFDWRWNICDWVRLFY